MKTRYIEAYKMALPDVAKNFDELMCNGWGKDKLLSKLKSEPGISFVAKWLTALYIKWV